MWMGGDLCDVGLGKKVEKGRDCDGWFVVASVALFTS